MISMTHQYKHVYEDMMDDYLARRNNADELVRAFFDQRRSDNDSDLAALAGRPWEPSPERDRWEEIFGMLFNACEDVDMSEDDGEPPAPNWIDEREFRNRVEAILPMFKGFRIDDGS